MKELLQLEKDFQRGRALVVAAIVCSFGISLTAIVLAFKYTDDFSKRIYLIKVAITKAGQISNSLP